MNLADLMSSEPLTLEPELSLRGALNELTAAGVSGAPVVVGPRLVGVISASDILDFQASNPAVPSYRAHQQEWGEWGPGDQVGEDVTEPASTYFRVMWDDASAELVERMAEPDSPEWDLLAEHAVGEVMTRRIVALPPTADVAEVARLMARMGVHRLIVADGDTLVGIVSALDVVRAVAGDRLRPVT